MNLPAYPMAASRITPGIKLKTRDERLFDFGCSIATEVVIRFSLRMKSNYQGILRKMFKRTNSASRSARATAHPSSERLSLPLLMWLSPFDFYQLGTRPAAFRRNQSASQGPKALADRWSQGGASDPKFYPVRATWRLQGVNQVELQAVQVRLLLSGLGDGRNAAVVVEEGNVVFQIGVQSASMPPGKAGQRIGPQFPKSIDAVLQNVGGSSLIAFDERCDRGVLFFAVPGVAHLNVVFVLYLAYADIKPVFLVLAAQGGDDCTLGIQRMTFGIEVVQELQ